VCLLKAGQDDIRDVVGVSALVFDRRRMRAEIGRDDTNRADPLQLARRAQHLQFGFDIEAVAGFDLDRGDAFQEQRIETRQGRLDEPVDR
jgi:hypothetical protein